jgi:hypothetical protein
MEEITLIVQCTAIVRLNTVLTGTEQVSDRIKDNNNEIFDLERAL